MAQEFILFALGFMLTMKGLHKVVKGVQKRSSRKPFWSVMPSSVLFCCCEFNCFKVDNYRPQTKLGKGNVFTPVCQSFCSQGGGRCLPQCMLGYTPLGRHPPPCLIRLLWVFRNGLLERNLCSRDLTQSECCRWVSW